MFGFNPLQIIQGIVIAAIIAAVGGYVWHCESVKTEYAVFKSNVELLGKKAEADRIKREAEDKRAKENADAEHAKTVADLGAVTKRLRDARASRGFLPSPAPAAKRPDILTFNRGELDAALRRLDDGVSGLVAEGDSARIDLDTAKNWAKEVSSRP